MSRLVPSRLSRYAPALVVATASCLSTLVHADSKQAGESLFDEVNWHGFLSQGFSLTDHNNYLGSSSDGSFKFNEAGLNASWRPIDPLQLSVQGLYKQIGNTEPHGTQLDYAIVDWLAIDDFDYGAGLRIGRLKHPYGFFNETRDIAATRPSILLPESMYIDYLQQLLHSSDSVGAYGHRQLTRGVLSFSAVVGKPILNEQIIPAIVGSNTEGDLKKEKVAVARLGYEDNSGKWRTALSYNSFSADFSAEFNPLQGKVLLPGEVDIEQWLLSAELNVENWQFMAEYQLRDIEYQDIYTFVNQRGGNSNPDRLYEGVAYYVHMGYRFSPELTGYVRRDTIYLDKHDKGGKDFEVASLGNAAARDAFAKDFTLGMSYIPSFEWAFGIEYHIINGTLWLPDLENRDYASQEQRWNMFLLQAAYRF